MNAILAEVIRIARDLKGLSPGSFPCHLGLHSMQERISHPGGILQIESVPGRGTYLLAQVPFG